MCRRVSWINLISSRYYVSDVDVGGVVSAVSVAGILTFIRLRRKHQNISLQNTTTIIKLNPNPRTWQTILLTKFSIENIWFDFCLNWLLFQSITCLVMGCILLLTKQLCRFAWSYSKCKKRQISSPPSRWQEGDLAEIQITCISRREESDQIRSESQREDLLAERKMICISRREESDQIRSESQLLYCCTDDLPPC